MTAVALALSSSLVWGFSDFLGGVQSRRRPLLAVLVVTQFGGLSLVAILVAVRGEEPPDAGGWIAWAAVASLVGICGLAAFYRGLATGPMGVVAPISSAAAIVPLTVGLATGDRPSAVQGAGVALAITGVVLASREENAEGGTGTGIATGAGLAIIAALGFGGFFVGLDRASEADVLYAVLVARVAALAALVAVTLATRTAVPTRPRDLAVLVPIGFGDTGANLLFALATTYGLLSLVGVLSSLYPVVTVLLARVVLHERLRAVQRIGAAGALAGAALISAG
jgi:drug/metabolite transporter (DMT)-like permease